MCASTGCRRRAAPAHPGGDTRGDKAVPLRGYVSCWRKFAKYRKTKIFQVVAFPCAHFTSNNRFSSNLQGKGALKEDYDVDNRSEKAQ